MYFQYYAFSSLIVHSLISLPLPTVGPQTFQHRLSEDMLKNGREELNITRLGLLEREHLLSSIRLRTSMTGFHTLQKSLRKDDS